MHKKSIISLLLLVLILLTACSNIHPGQLKSLKNREYENFKVYYVDSLPEKELGDFDKITEGMKEYLRKNFNIDTTEKRVNVAILPLDNKVVNFEKQGSSACTDYKNIYLLDFNNLPKEVYSQYGQAPENIYNTSYIHELAHLLTHERFNYSKKNKLETNELNSVSLTYIDFTGEEFSETPALREDFKINFTKEKISEVSKGGLVALSNATKDRTLGIFLYYLHLKKEYNRVKLFLEAENLDAFIKKARWTKEDDRAFLEWLNNYQLENIE